MVKEIDNGKFENMITTTDGWIHFDGDEFNNKKKHNINIETNYIYIILSAIK